MRHLPILLALFISVNVAKAQAQDSKFSIGFGGSYDVSNNEYTALYSIGFSSRLEYQDINQYSYGLQFNYLATEKLGVRVGMYYARKGYNLKYNWATYYPGYGGSVDPIVPIETEFQLDYLDLSVSAYYRVVDAKFYHLAPSVGIMNNILLDNREISTMSDGDTEENESDSNPSTYIPGFRLGLINDFDIGEHFFVSLEPYIYFQSKTIDESVVVSTDYTYGAYVSLNYKF